MTAARKPLSDRKITLHLSVAYALGVIAIFLALASHFRMLPQWTLIPIRTQMLSLEDKSGDSRAHLTTLGGGSALLSMMDDNGDVVLSGAAGNIGRGHLILSSGGGGSIHVDGGSPQMAPFIEVRDATATRLRLTLDDQGNPILINPVTGETKLVFDDPAEGG